MIACLMLLSLLLVHAGAAGAAGPARRLWSPRANLYDTPQGVVIGRLYRPERVHVLRRSANRRWANVRAAGRSGWLLVSKLCRA